MAEGTQLKRNIAFKFRIGDLLMGKPVSNEERFAFLELGDRKIVRVNIIGNIVDKYESEGESRYLSLTLDDGSGQIKLKSFSDDVERFKEILQGLTVAVIGTLRIYNNEVYISPEISGPSFRILNYNTLYMSNSGHALCLKQRHPPLTPEEV